MHKIIQIYPYLLKLSPKQESVTDGQTDGRYYYIPSPLTRGDNNDHYKPRAKHYSNLSMFTKVIV